MRKWSQTDKDHERKFVSKLHLVSIAKDKDTSINASNIFFIFKNICLVSTEWMGGCDLFKMSCFS